MEELRTALPRLRGWFVLAGILIGLFLLAPLLAILPLAFTSGQYLIFPPEGFSTQWFAEILDDPQWNDALLTSVKVAIAGAIIATLAGSFAAIGIRRLPVGRRVLRTLLLAPMVIPQLVLALGLYLVFRDLTGGTDLRVLTLGQATIATPLVFVTVSAGLAAVDPALSRAASSLGYRWPSIVWRVELPLVRRSIVSGAVLAFAVCFDEAVLAYFLSPPGEETLPTRIWQSASENASPSIAAASAIVMCIAVTLLALVSLIRPKAKS